ncbi:M56 family metallopeptidase [Actinocorallia aurantiaca]|uniref:M56 family metallopeptidase n=1 Tax=Actinocorallia aurantiaca TaxID=46204 RepID=A0ABP6GM55_9ACTN
MNWLTFLPAGITLALSVALGLLALPLHPMWCGRLLCTVAGTTGLATVGTFVFVAVNYWATLHPRAANRLPEWTLVGDDDPVPVWLGVPATVLTAVSLMIILWRSVRWFTEVRAAQRMAEGLLRTDVPIAVAVPGRRGGVLVSRGLLQALEPAELEVVFRHESSHLRHRHHRYLAVGALAAGTLPPLRWLNERMRFALERWADEDAADATGDRELVARTIARVAILRSEPIPGTAGFSDSGVIQRVRALLDEAPGRNPVTGPVSLICTGLATGTLALVALQLDRAFNLSFM